MKQEHDGNSTRQRTRNELNEGREVLLDDTPRETMWTLIGVIVGAAEDGGLPPERCVEIFGDLHAGIAGHDGIKCMCGGEGCKGTVNLDDVSWNLFRAVERLAERNRELYARLGGNV